MVVLGKVGLQLLTTNSGQKVCFSLAGQQMGRGRDIVHALQQAVNHASLELPLPTVADPALENVLTGILAQQAGKQSRTLGIERLGWNDTKTRFMAPGWLVGALGEEAAARVIHPAAKVIRSHYRFDENALTDRYDLVTPQAAYWISLLAAMLTRSFLNVPIAVMPIRRSPQSLALVQAIFRPLGQVAPIELGTKLRQVRATLNPDYFSGYPVYATCPDPEMLEALNYPAFVFTGAGARIDEDLTPGIITQISSLSHRVLISLLQSLARDPVQAQSLIGDDHVQTSSQLAAEGRRIVKSQCGIKDLDVFASEMPLLATMLAQVPAHRTQDYFRRDERTGEIHIRSRKLRGVKREALWNELAANNPEVRLQGDHYLAVPAAWFLKQLEKYYGGPVVLDDWTRDGEALAA